MKPLAAPRRIRPRTAAVQSLAEAPSSTVLKRGVARAGAADPAYLAKYQDWQGWARRYARSLAVVQFAVGLPSSVASRCNLFVEERDELGAWNETEDPRLVGAMESYRNTRQDTKELVRMHFRHYDVAGECVQVVTDGGSGPDWWIFSTAAIEVNKPAQGMVTVKLTPDGRVSEDTAFAVPREQVVRFWRPDEEWQAYATAPMVAIIDDLKRFHALAKYAQATADSAAAMGGLLWTPSEAHVPRGSQDDGDMPNPGEPSSVLEDAYYALARRRFDPNDDDITAIVPPLIKWDDALKPPLFVKLVESLDPAGIAYRREALEDIARGFPLPSSLVMGGGPGDANHWTEWLVDRKFFDNAVADTMELLCHHDLTTTFLRPLLAMHGLPFARYRVGYDPAPVLVKQDKSELALKLYVAGLLKGDKALEEADFEAIDRMDATELATLLEVLSRRAQGERPPGAGAGPENVTEAPPAVPLAAALAAYPEEAMRGFVAGLNGHAVEDRARALVTDVTRAAAAAYVPLLADVAVDVPKPPTKARTNRLLARLARIRANLGRELLAASEAAFAEALHRAGVKAQARSKGRASKRVDDAVVAAVRSGGALRPHLAAIGLREDELLRDSFATFAAVAAERFRRARGQQAAAIERAGYDPAEMMPADSSELAASTLAATLTALAFTRLMDGAPAGVIVGGIPAGPGEVTGVVPARAVTQAIAVAEGTATATAGPTSAIAPSISLLGDRRSIERALADHALSALRESRAEAIMRSVDGPPAVEQPEPEVLYVWRHGFYGDPLTPFEPHEDLGASEFTTTDPTGDPALTNAGGFPEGGLYQPQDHDGCTCEWEIVVGDTSMAQLTLGSPEFV